MPYLHQSATARVSHDRAVSTPVLESTTHRKHGVHACRHDLNEVLGVQHGEAVGKLLIAFAGLHVVGGQLEALETIQPQPAGEGGERARGKSVQSNQQLATKHGKCFAGLDMRMPP